MAKGKKKTTKKSKKTTETKKSAGAAPPVEQAPDGAAADDGWEPESVFGGEPTTAEPMGVEESLKAQIEAYRHQLARMGADFANFRRRASEEKSKTLLYANESLVNALLPILDDFDRGIGHMDEGATDSSEVFDGVKLIWRRLLKILEGIGVLPFESVGERFDPLMHEAMQIMDQEGLPGGTIIQELEKGYKYHERLLRAAKVIVTPLNKKAPAMPPEAKEEEQPEAEDSAAAEAVEEVSAEETPVVSDSDGLQDSPWGDGDGEETDKGEEEEVETQAEILEDDDDDEEFEVIPEEEDDLPESDDEKTVPVVEIDESALLQDFELDEASFEAGFGPDAVDVSPGDAKDDDADLDFIEEETSPELDVPEKDH